MSSEDTAEFRKIAIRFLIGFMIAFPIIFSYTQSVSDPDLDRAIQLSKDNTLLLEKGINDLKGLDDDVIEGGVAIESPQAGYLRGGRRGLNGSVIVGSSTDNYLVFMYQFASGFVQTAIGLVLWPVTSIASITAILTLIPFIGPILGSVFLVSAIYFSFSLISSLIERIKPF